MYQFSFEKLEVWKEASEIELMNQLILSKELGFLSQDKYLDLRSSISKISNMLNALRKAQLNTSTNKQ